MTYLYVSKNTLYVSYVQINKYSLNENFLSELKMLPAKTKDHLTRKKISTSEATFELLVKVACETPKTLQSIATVFVAVPRGGSRYG